MFNSNQFFGGGAGDFYPVSIDQSLRFNDNDSAYLTHSPNENPSTAGIFTFSFWFKLSNPSSPAPILYPYTDGNNFGQIALSSNQLSVYSAIGGSAKVNVKTTAVLRDYSAWYHAVIKFNSTSGNEEIKIYLNGVDQSLTTTTAMTAHTPKYAANGVTHYLGSNFNQSGLFDGYLAEVHFCDGEAYTADAFGELKSGVWVAKAPSVTYGTNGFHLDFANSADIGNDISGEGNDWTPNNFTASDVVLDSPTDNHCTWNPLNLGGGTLSDGNLRWVASNSIGLLCTATMAFDVESTTNKYYWEVTVSSGEMVIGIAPTTLRGSDTGRAGSYGYYGNPGSKFSGTSSSSYGANFGSGDVIGVAVGDGKITFYKNGVSQGDAFTGLTGIFVPFIAEVTCDITANFGQLGFTYTPPTGYLALSTANLPDPVIDPAQGSSPEDYFGIDTYTGNGGTIDSDFGFDCDLVWYKNRSRANTFHYLFDQVRGDDLPLYSNDTFTEDSQFPTYHTQSFITGGSRIVRTLGDHLNFSGDSYVAWAWKANGSGVSNTDGSITSTVSANTESGFSIVSYTGTGSATNTDTVGHGLDTKPDLYIIKNRDVSGAWLVRTDLIDGTSDYGNLNTTTDFQSSTVNYATDSVFSLGSTSLDNGSGNAMIAYCFHSVEGFSKFGKYTGNGSADGTFVYTGFRPAFVMVKRTNSAAAWYIYDDKRNSYNLVEDVLQPQDSAAEFTSANNAMDFTSNGFKLRGGGGTANGSGDTYIYMAFAENPFKYSNAR